MAGLFQVLWGQPDGTFQPAEALNVSDGEPLIIPPGDDAEQYGGTSLENICTRPTAVDWDADGDLDLVVGNFGGSFYVFYGEGEGVFQPQPESILLGDEMLKIAGHHSDPFIVDWDNDGDLDLLSGSSNGGVQWAENVADAGEIPELEAFEPLIPAEPRVASNNLLDEDDLEGPKTSTRIWVDDVNDDGKLDLLVGDSVTLVSPANGLSVAEYEEKFAEWNKKVQEVSTRMTELMEAAQEEQEQTAAEQTVEDDPNAEAEGADGSAVGKWLLSVLGMDDTAAQDEPPEVSELQQAQQEISTLYGERSEFMDSRSTGFVWLYLQK